jgi:DNA (cytosine-5)-methyltransferase 1
MLENVRGFMGKKFESYRMQLKIRFGDLGYEMLGPCLLAASDFGVPQLRPRTVIVAFRKDSLGSFAWPGPVNGGAPSVGIVLKDLMAQRGWRGAHEWAVRASTIAPTLVGGSKKHGGADLGPTRAKKAWLEIGVDGMGLANEPPSPGWKGPPKLTVRMAARLQGFPDDWKFYGGKTAQYRQVGNAFPPPVAKAVAEQIRDVLRGSIRNARALKK